GGLARREAHGLTAAVRAPARARRGQLRLRGRPRAAAGGGGGAGPMSEVRYRVEVMHGVNLDQLGRRDPLLYGTLTLPELERQIEAHAEELALGTRFFHTNHEGAFVEHLHSIGTEADAILLNPGAWTHYAWAIRDALEI